MMKQYEVFGEEMTVEKGILIVSDEMCELGIAEYYSIGEKVPCLRMHMKVCGVDDRIAFTTYFPDDNDECENLWNESEYNDIPAYLDTFVAEAE